MSFAGAITTCFRKYVTFSGRASRPEYWWFVLFIILGSIVAGILDAAIFDAAMVETAPGEITAQSDGPIAVVFSLLTLIPAISAAWRRMHDTGRSGFFVLYPLIVMVGIALFAGVVSGFGTLLSGDFGAIVGAGSTLIIGAALIVFFLSPLIVLYWLTRPSEDGPNAYGPQPVRSR